MKNKCVWLGKKTNNKYFCGYAADGLVWWHQYKDIVLETWEIEFLGADK